MNVLVMSISKKIPMLKAVKSALSRFNVQSSVYGADTDDSCTGKYFVDVFWKCPPINKLPIWQFIQYCKSHQIKIVFPSRDGELIYFSKHKEELNANGIHVMISDLKSVRLCIDKLLFYQMLSRKGYPIIPTFSDLNFKSDRYVVKERYGAGAVNAGIGLNYIDVEQHASRLRDPIFQPYISGIECSVDVYLNNQSIPHGAVVRKRNRVVGGESQVTSSFRDEHIEKLCCEIGQSFLLKGHVLFQLIIDETGALHIIECNCRFGGASTLSIALGLDSFYWFMIESTGGSLNQVPFIRSPEEKTLIRHSEDFIL